MTFSDALEAAKRGSKIAREGWNGKNQWVVFSPTTEIEASDLAPPPLGRTMERVLPDLVPVSIEVGSFMSLWTAQGTLQIGWVPSQGDMSANDWILVE